MRHRGRQLGPDRAVVPEGREAQAVVSLETRSWAAARVEVEAKGMRGAPRGQGPPSPALEGGAGGVCPLRPQAGRPPPPPRTAWKGRKPAVSSFSLSFLPSSLLPSCRPFCLEEVHGMHTEPSQRWQCAGRGFMLGQHVALFYSLGSVSICKVHK